MRKKVAFFVRCAYAPGVVDDEVRRDAEGSRFSQMIGSLVAASVPFAQIAGEPWRIRRSAKGVAALLAVEIAAGDVERFADAVKRCVASPGLIEISVDTFEGKDRQQAQRLLIG